MKNTIKAATLAIVLTFGSTFAMAGIIAGGNPTPATCQEKKGILVSDAPTPGIIAGGSPIVAGVVAVLVGIIAGGKAEPAPCVEMNGILVSD
jgi:hypothetical protein